MQGGRLLRWELILHHLFALTLHFFPVCLFHKFSAISAAGYFAELSTPFVNARWMLSKTGRSRSTAYAGSVLPFVFIEVCVAVGTAIVALWFMPDEAFSPVGHQMVGALLAFLVVFRSQIAWGMYSEGRGHVGAIIASARVVAIQMIEDLANNAEMGHDKVFEAEEGVRLLKLYYYSVVEHVRSTDGQKAWTFAQRVAHSFATPEEVAIFRAEFGEPQQKRKAVVSTAPPGVATVYKHRRNFHSGLAVTTARLENRAYHSDSLMEANGASLGAGKDGADAVAPIKEGGEARASTFTGAAPPPSDMRNPHDPTKGKPLLVLMWLRLATRKLERKVGEYDRHLISLVSAFNGIDKVDKMVLPLPYCQLLKIFLFLWVGGGRFDSPVWLCASS